MESEGRSPCRIFRHALIISDFLTANPFPAPVHDMPAALLRPLLSKESTQILIVSTDQVSAVWNAALLLESVAPESVVMIGRSSGEAPPAGERNPRHAARGPGRRWLDPARRHPPTWRRAQAGRGRC